MLAIIIPYYKLVFFEETLLSLAGQTDQRFKVYIGDDDSPDDPRLLLEKFKGRFDFVYYKFEENLGSVSLAKQWERCIGLTLDEKWYMILGDDDVLGSTVVGSFYKYFDEFSTKTHLVRFASKLIYENLNTISNLYKHPVWESATASFYRKFKQLSRSSLSEYIFSRASFQKHGFFNYSLAWNSDDRAWLDFSDNKPIFTINESVVFVRISLLNITGRSDNILSKNLSEVQFYKYLISNKFKFYDDNQRLEIIKKYGKEIKRTRRLNLSEWIFIIFYCLIFFNVGFLKKGFSMFFNK